MLSKRQKSILYHNKVIHLIVDEFLQLSFFQFAFVPGVLVKNLDNGHHATLQI